jgi:4-hydroxybenzoate polyprenyltransferase
MVAFQAGIGALNDVADAETDRTAKPGKPIPRGLVSPPTAAAVVLAGLIVGTVLSLPSGVQTVAIGLTGAGIGCVYDLRLKGSAWAWLPFALGIPLLPVYAWLGATGTIPAVFALLLPVGIASGAALAIGNALADVERDAASAIGSPAVRLGSRRAWLVHLGLYAFVALVAVVSLRAIRSGGAGVLLVLLGSLLVAIGVALAADTNARRRERGWELEAVGTAVVGIGWLAGVASAGT